MLIKRTQRQRSNASRGSSRTPCRLKDGGLDRRTFLRRSGLAGGGLAALERAAARQRAQGGGRGRRAARRSGATIRKSVCTHCAVGCTVTAEVLERRLDRAGAELGFPDQSRLALRQGRLGARAGAQRPPASISDEARQRPVDARVVGHRDQRDRRQADADPREVGRGFGLLARLGQDDQRRLLSVPQARRVLGHQQHRPPGAHLPFDDRHRRGQHLGLRRDDQQLSTTSAMPRRMVIMGGNPAEAHPVSLQHLLEGKELNKAQLHRHRSAPDAHRRACDRICAHAARHRHSGAVRHDVAHPQERLGGQGIHRSSASTASTISARKSRSGIRRRSSASPACRASSSSASPRCSPPRSRRR